MAQGTISTIWSKWRYSQLSQSWWDFGGSRSCPFCKRVDFQWPGPRVSGRLGEIVGCVLLVLWCTAANLFDDLYGRRVFIRRLSGPQIRFRNGVQFGVTYADCKFAIGPNDPEGFLDLPCLAGFPFLAACHFASVWSTGEGSTKSLLHITLWNVCNVPLVIEAHGFSHVHTWTHIWCS